MRIKKLQKIMKEKNIDLCLFFSLDVPNTNLIYFSGYEGKGVLAVTKSNHFLIIPEYEKAKAENISGRILYAEKSRFLLDVLKENAGNIKKTGTEEDKISVRLHKKIKNKIKGRYTDISGICREIRAIKDEEELSYIKKACSVTDSIFEKICTRFNFRTEDEIRDFIKTECKKNHCELAFPPIAASASGTSMVHYEGSKELQKGFLMLDFGAKYKGYCSDMTRMLYLGSPKKEELEKFELVLKTIRNCETSALDKKRFSELHKLAVEELGKESEFFTHYLGHGLGLDIHESPNLGPDSKELINESIPFTIEPGIYYPGKFGVRIEDTVIILNKKLLKLTKSKKELVII